MNDNNNVPLSGSVTDNLTEVRTEEVEQLFDLFKRYVEHEEEICYPEFPSVDYLDKKTGKYVRCKCADIQFPFLGCWHFPV